jgi:hypothetical protein
MLLRRLSSTAAIVELIGLYGGEKTVWSRAVYWMAVWLYENWGHMMASIKPQWVDRFPLYAQCVENLVNEAGAGFAPGSLRTALYIDCNQLVILLCSCTSLLRALYFFP